uniref:Aspartic peptidase DDI1-type domain-containing protein n=1 Tax=Noccaea caerulescens TaxID=107243 RepID=A0A1J3FJJ7_NOCCA
MGETFCEGWERFKNYLTQCPHHSYSTESLLSTLYRGVLPKYRQMLDTASQENFLGMHVDDGLALVENLAMSDGNYNEEYDRTNRSSVDSEEKHKKELKTLNDKLDKLILGQNKQTVHLVEDCDDAQEEEFLTEEMNYVGNQGGYNYKNNPNLSYRSTNVANPQDQVYPPQVQPSGQTKTFVPFKQQGGFVRNQNQGNFQPKSNSAPPGFEGQQGQGSNNNQQEPNVRQMLHQVLQGQTSGALDLSKKFAEVNNRVDMSYHDLNTKIETLSGRVQQMEGKGAGSSTRQQGQLPGKAVDNPKEYAHAVTLRSGKEIQPPVKPIQLNEDIDVQERGIAIENDTPEPQLEEKAQAEQRNQKEVSKKKENTFVPPPYKPKLPFPARFKKQQLEKFKALFDEQLKEIEVKMPLLDAFMLIPPYQKFLNDAVLERTKEVQSMVVLSHECSTIIQRKVVQKKLGDPGSFTLPCSLGPLAFNSCLCDLGASVSLMPLTVAKNLGFEKYKDCKISLVLADRSIRLLVGMLEDLPVRIGNVEIPTDFVVLEMNEEPKDPLILGRPFLATAGAVIDVKKGKIELNLGKYFRLKFDIKDVMKKPTIEGQLFWVETLDQLADEYLKELAAEDQLQLTLTKEPEEKSYFNTVQLEYARLLDSHKILTEEPLVEDVREGQRWAVEMSQLEIT